MNTGDPAELLRSLSAQIAQCRDAPAGKAKEAFGEALGRVIQLRNERLHADGTMLRQLNAVLSLMASIEFPLGGFHRERIGQVVRALDALE